MGEAECYVHTDERGVMRVGRARVPLESIIYPFNEGQSPESIRGAYPSLSLEEIYGAIAFYLGHKQEVGDYLERQAALWRQSRAEQDRNPPPAVQRLKDLKAARAKEGAA